MVRIFGALEPALSAAKQVKRKVCQFSRDFIGRVVGSAKYCWFWLMAGADHFKGRGAMAATNMYI